MDAPTIPSLPVAGEMTDEAFGQIAGGQPVLLLLLLLLLLHGRPAAVVVDLDSCAEAELATTDAP